MTMDGVLVFAALTSQYRVYNKEFMTATELSPLDPQSDFLPTVTKTTGTTATTDE